MLHPWDSEKFQAETKMRKEEELIISLNMLSQTCIGTVQNDRKNARIRWYPGLSKMFTNGQFCYQVTFCVFIYGETVYILSYKYVLKTIIFLPFNIWE